MFTPFTPPRTRLMVVPNLDIRGLLFIFTGTTPI
jgi:hypothetical protein